MAAQVIRQSRIRYIEVTLPLSGSMLQAEEAIQDGLNEVGLLATEEKLKQFDTDGSPIQLGSVRMTTRAVCPITKRHTAASPWHGMCIKRPRGAKRSVHSKTTHG